MFVTAPFVKGTWYDAKLTQTINRVKAEIVCMRLNLFIPSYSLVTWINECLNSMPLRMVVMRTRLAINITENGYLYQFLHYDPNSEFNLTKNAIDSTFTLFLKAAICRKIFFRLTPS